MFAVVVGVVILRAFFLRSGDVVNLQYLTHYPDGYSPFLLTCYFPSEIQVPQPPNEPNTTVRGWLVKKPSNKATFS